jgi:MATE family multidrug resistance protein
MNQDNFLPRFYRLAIVNILSNIMVPLAGLISVAFLGHLAEIRYLAGVTLATILFNYLYRGLGFLRMGTTGVTAQAVGRNDTEAMLLVGLRNGITALALGLLILILQYPLREVGFALLSATPGVKAAGIAYFNARIWGAPAVLINFVLIGWLLGKEESGKVFWMSIVGNFTNILLDYFLIVRWGWDSTGAGISAAASQYLTLFMGLIFVGISLPWQQLKAVWPQLGHLSAYKETFTLNSNIFIRTLAIMSTFAIFTGLSATLGTVTLTENALIFQVFYLTVFFFEGVGFATETLSGNFKGQETNEQLIPLIKVSISTSLVVGFTFAMTCILFPKTVFGLLTDHQEITQQITYHVRWLLIILICSAIAFMLDGYFIGLAEGEIIRNVSLTAAVVGFSPVAVLAWYYHNNHILWLALSMFIASRAILLVSQLPRTFEYQNEHPSVS